MSERIQLRRTKGWRKPEGCILVARRSRWGNPFIVHGASVIGRPWSVVRERDLQRPVQFVGDEVGYVTCSHVAEAIAHSVDLFRAYCKVTQRDTSDAYEKWLAPLRGHDLGCWCPLDQLCHADVLLEIANAGAP